MSNENPTDEELDHILDRTAEFARTASRSKTPMTLRQWMRDLIVDVVNEGEGFSGKRANVGFSGWDGDLLEEVGGKEMLQKLVARAIPEGRR